MSLYDDLLPQVPAWQALQAMVADGASPDLLAWALSQGYPYARTLPDGRVLCVAPMTYGKGRLHVGTQADIGDSW